MGRFLPNEYIIIFSFKICAQLARPFQKRQDQGIALRMARQRNHHPLKLSTDRIVTAASSAEATVARLQSTHSRCVRSASASSLRPIPMVRERSCAWTARLSRD